MNTTETNRIEYKLELSKEVDLEKEAVAFLNYHEGGIIYVGIDNEGVVHGVEDLDDTLLKAKDRLKTNILPSCMGLFDVRAEEIEGKQVIKIVLASGSEKPYYKRKYGMSEKGCFIRSGSGADPMPQKLIDELFSKRTRASLGKIKSNRQELSFEQLKIYYQESDKSLNKAFAKNLELLTEENNYNYVGYLMADQNSNSVKVAKYLGTDRVDLAETNEYGNCSIIKATKSVLDKLELENKVQSTITSKERKEEYLWNSIALREAVLNAMVHNDYSREIPPKFEVFNNRIEITSTGGLPDGLSEEEFFEGFSVPRNKEIMRIFKDLGLVEQLGSGVPRILKFYGKECFLFSENFVRMSFPCARNKTELITASVRERFGKGSEKNLFTPEENRALLGEFSEIMEIELIESYNFSNYLLLETFGKGSGKDAEKTLSTPFLVIELLYIYPEITASEIATHIAVSDRTVEKHIQKLKKSSLINRIGGRKNGSWQIIKQP